MSQNKTAVFAPAKVLHAPRPQYPRQARRRALEGQVVLKIEVQANGKPGNITVVASSGHGVLDKAAVQGIQRWRFQPARRGNQTITASLQVPVTFRLQD